MANKLDLIIEKGVVNRLEKGLLKEADSIINDIAKNYRISAHEVKEKFKTAIFEYVKKDLGNKGYEFDGHIKSDIDVYHLADFSIVKEFFKEVWRTLPFTMPQEDFDKMQACIKRPLKLRYYNPNNPIYKFVKQGKLDSNYTFRQVKNKSIVQNTQFYLADDENGQSLYAKQTEFVFEAKKLKKGGVSNEDASKSEYEKLKEEELYSRTLSISLFALLDGNPNKALSVMRYDNQYDSKNEHVNTWVGNDKRFNIFGGKISYPHFHFQNENDTIFCLKKKCYSSDYMVSKCCGIDCKHLKRYLLDIDSKSGKNLEAERQENGSYGMPFLSMKEENYKFKINVNKMLDEYFTEQEINKDTKTVLRIGQWMENSKDNEEYKDGQFKSFANLIKTIDFLKHLNLIRKEKDLTAKDFEMLSDIEVMIASEMVNEVNRISNKFVTKEVDGKEEEFYLD